MPPVLNYDFMTSRSKTSPVGEGGGELEKATKCPPATSGATVCGAEAESVYLVFILHFIISPPLIHWLLYAPLTTAHR